MTSLLGPLAACQDQGVKAFNAAPEASIRSHADGDRVDSDLEVVVEGRVSDPDDGLDELLASWRVDGETACEAAAPAADGTTSCTLVFDADATVALEVVDPGGASASAFVSLVLAATGSPGVEIREPTPATVLYSDQLITLEGLVQDEEDGAQALGVVWSSSLDGELDVGGSTDTDGTVRGSVYLGEGQHALTLRATDTTGKTGSDSVNITVGPPNSAPTCAITAPASGDSGSEGRLVTFEGTVGDVDVPSDWLDVTWTSDKDGELGTSTPDSTGAVLFPFSDLSVDTHVVSMQVRDEVGATCTASVVFTVGSPPSIQITSPAPGDVSNDGATLALSALASDEQDAATELSVRWESDLDGELAVTTPDSAGGVGLSTRALTVGEHTVTATATDTHGLTASDTVSFRVNGLPDAPSVSISPDPASTSDALLANIDVDSVDPEGDAVTYTYAWSVDGVASSAHTGASVPASDTARDETWRVVVTPNDGSGDGATGAASIIIANTAPAVSTVSIAPTSALTNDVLSVAVTATDVDGDSVSFGYAWYVDGALAGSSSSLDGATSFDRGQDVFVVVTPDDGSDTGSALTSATVTVGNTPPSAPTVSLAPTRPVAGSDDLVCSIDAASTDDDGDSISYTITWTVDGVSYTGASTTTLSGDTVPASDTSSGEVWVCTVTPDDGADTGTADSASTTVVSDCTSISVALLPGWGSSLSSTSWSRINSSWSTWGDCSVSIRQVSHGYTLSSLVSGGYDVLLFVDPAGGNELITSSEEAALRAWLSGGYGGIVSTYLIKGAHTDNSHVADLFGVDASGLGSSGSSSATTASLVVPSHPLCADLPSSYRLTAFASTQIFSSSIASTLDSDAEIVIESTDSRNVVIAYEGAWRAVLFTGMPEYQTSSGYSDTMQTMYNALHWAAGY